MSKLCENGHKWEPDPSGLFPWRCHRCPAFAGDCVECRDGPSRHCQRCGGSGRVELCEIGQDELSQLKLTGRRFQWLLAVWSAVCGDKAANVIASIDQALEHGDSPLAVAALAGGGIKGQKKPVAGLRRPRASSEIPGYTPGFRDGRTV